MYICTRINVLMYQYINVRAYALYIYMYVYMIMIDAWNHADVTMNIHM